ncbi:conjugal transfer protein TraO [Phocaeicola sp.]
MRRMKKFLGLTLALLALAIGQADAQRCLPGMKGVQFTADMADGFYSPANRNDAGFAFGLSVSTYTKGGNQWKFGGEIMQRYYPYRNTRIPLAQYTGEGGYYYNFFSDPAKMLFLNIGGSALMGYETVNGGKKLLNDGAALQSYESFIYGGAVTLEAEAYLSDKVVLLFRLRERVLWGSAANTFHTQYGLGLKIIL